jgi:hypothetical protein
MAKEVHAQKNYKSEKIKSPLDPSYMRQKYHGIQEGKWINNPNYLIYDFRMVPYNIPHF